MKNETQLQKAIAIAVKDGWVESFIKSVDGKTIYDKGNNVLVRAESLLESYSTDLNYLMPIAVKVLKEIGIQEASIQRDYVFNAYSILYDAYYELKLDENNQYTELFNALYEAVKLLGDE